MFGSCFGQLNYKKTFFRQLETFNYVLDIYDAKDLVSILFDIKMALPLCKKMSLFPRDHTEVWSYMTYLILSIWASKKTQKEKIEQSDKINIVELNI